MKIKILENNRPSRENLKVIQGIKFLNSDLSLREARDIAVGGGEFEVTNKNEDEIDSIFYAFALLEVKWVKL